ncbi:MAG: tetratricopeptide repeat protein [Alphaproteobacteria bacterium]|nr:tetratricopeptide repeat protein [Alphaproteobacteria bacterium]
MNKFSAHLLTVLLCRKGFLAQVNSPEMLGFLAQIALDAGKKDKAIDIYSKIEPQYRDEINRTSLSVYEKGMATYKTGDFENAEQSYREAIKIDPYFAEAYISLGKLLYDGGYYAEASHALYNAVKLHDVNADVFFLFAAALRDAGFVEEAVAACQKGVLLRPEDTLSYINLGNVCKFAGYHKKAVDAFRKALDIEPEAIHILEELVHQLNRMGRTREAAEKCLMLIDAEPTNPVYYVRLALEYLDQGRFAEAEHRLRTAEELSPTWCDASVYSLMMHLYKPSVTLVELKQIHQDFDEKYGTKFREYWGNYKIFPEPNRALRIGFVSSRFGKYQVGHFTLSAIEKINRERFNISIYSSCDIKDSVTHRFMNTADNWVDATKMNEEELFNKIIDDKIDILFNLDGFRNPQHMEVFARRPAPLQISWADYPSTTGSSAIDYLIADEYHINEETEKYYSERIIYIPNSYVCYSPSYDSADLIKLPAHERGYITFGAFHSARKIVPEMCSVWAEILLKLPTARLIIKGRGVDDIANYSRIYEPFYDRGIDLSRIELRSEDEHLHYRSNSSNKPKDSTFIKTGYLSEYNEIDIALDSYPYSSGLAACDAMYMGVPVITMPSDTFASCHAYSHINNAGLSETIAFSPDEYVEKAVEFATNTQKLAVIRKKLRSQLLSSPLCDSSRFAKNLESAMSQIWQEWCKEDSGF